MFYLLCCYTQLLLKDGNNNTDNRRSGNMATLEIITHPWSLIKNICWGVVEEVDSNKVDNCNDVESIFGFESTVGMATDLFSRAREEEENRNYSEALRLNERGIEHLYNAINNGSFSAAARKLLLEKISPINQSIRNKAQYINDNEKRAWVSLCSWDNKLDISKGSNTIQRSQSGYIRERTGSAKSERATLFKFKIGNVPNTLTEEDYQELASKTEGYLASDINLVVRDAFMERNRKTQTATHWCYVSGPSKTHANITVNDFLTPCSPATPGAFKMSRRDVPAEKLLSPPINMADLLRLIGT